MNLKNIEESLNGLQVPKAVKYMNQPEWEEVVCGFPPKNELEKAYDIKERQLKILYTGIKLKMKLNLARRSMMTLHLLSYLNHRDTIIMNKNDLINKLNIYKHDLDLDEKQNIINIYETQKGAKRYPHVSSYEYFIKTGQEPYSIVVN